MADELYQGYIKSRGRLPSFSAREKIKQLNKSLNVSQFEQS